MTRLLLAAGTRGDVQPYAALALRWQAAGERVVVAAPRLFAGLVQAHGVPWAELPPGPNALLNRPEFGQALSGPGHLRQAWAFWRQAGPLYAAQMQAGWALARAHRAHQVVFGLPTLWGRHVAEAVGAEPLVAALQPLTRTRRHPSALWAQWAVHRQPQPAWVNLFTHHSLEIFLAWVWRGVTARWRARHGLRPDARAGLGWPDIPHAYGYSPALAPRPDDWPEKHQVAGEWRAPVEVEPRRPEVERWLERHRPAIYFSAFTAGWAERPQALAALQIALEALNAYAVVPAAHVRAPHPRVLAVPPVPHDWLFPLVEAVAHHGGCGTTHAGARARRPMLILPQGADQFFWAGRVQALRLGPPPVLPGELTPAVLTARLHALLHQRFATLA